MLPQPQASAPQGLLLIQVGPVYCCTPSDPVQAVVLPPRLHRPAGTDPNEPGVLEYGEHIVKVIDARRRFGLSIEPGNRGGRIVITHDADEWLGFWVDEVMDVIAMPEAGWGPAPALIPRKVFTRTLLRDERVFLYTELRHLNQLEVSAGLRAYVRQLAVEKAEAQPAATKPTAAATPSRGQARLTAPTEQPTTPRSPSARKQTTPVETSTGGAQITPARTPAAGPAATPRTAKVATSAPALGKKTRKTLSAAKPKAVPVSVPAPGASVARKPASTSLPTPSVAHRQHPSALTPPARDPVAPTPARAPAPLPPTSTVQRTAGRPADVSSPTEAGAAGMWGIVAVAASIVAAAGLSYYLLWPEDAPTTKSTVIAYQPATATVSSSDPAAPVRADTTSALSPGAIAETTQLAGAQTTASADVAQNKVVSAVAATDTSDTRAGPWGESGAESTRTPALPEQPEPTADPVADADEASLVTVAAPATGSSIWGSDTAASDSEDATELSGATPSSDESAEVVVGVTSATGGDENAGTQPGVPAVDGPVSSIWGSDSSASAAADVSLADAAGDSLAPSGDTAPHFEGGSDPVDARPEGAADDTHDATATSPPSTDAAIAEEAGTGAEAAGLDEALPPSAEDQGAPPVTSEDALVQREEIATDTLLNEPEPEADQAATPAPEPTAAMNDAAGDEPNATLGERPTSAEASEVSEPLATTTAVEVDDETAALPAALAEQSAAGANGDVASAAADGAERTVAMDSDTSTSLTASGETQSGEIGEHSASNNQLGPTPGLNEASDSETVVAGVGAATMSAGAPSPSVEEPDTSPTEVAMAVGATTMSAEVAVEPSAERVDAAAPADNAPASELAPTVPGPDDAALADPESPTNESATLDAEPDTAAASAAPTGTTEADFAEVAGSERDAATPASVAGEHDNDGAAQPLVEVTPDGDTPQPQDSGDAAASLATGAESAPAQEAPGGAVETVEPAPSATQAPGSPAPGSPSGIDTQAPADRLDAVATPIRTAIAATARDKTGYYASIERDEQGVIIVLHDPAIYATEAPESAAIDVDDASAGVASVPAIDPPPAGELANARDTPMADSAAPRASATTDESAGASENTTAAPLKRAVRQISVTHVVVKGDTLWHIAERYVNNPFRYPELARLSNIADPDWIYPGDVVRIIKHVGADTALAADGKL